MLNTQVHISADNLKIQTLPVMCGNIDVAYFDYENMQIYNITIIYKSEYFPLCIRRLEMRTIKTGKTVSRKLT